MRSNMVRTYSQIHEKNPASDIHSSGNILEHSTILQRNSRILMENSGNHEKNCRNLIKDSENPERNSAILLKNSENLEGNSGIFLRNSGIMDTPCPKQTDSGTSGKRRWSPGRKNIILPSRIIGGIYSYIPTGVFFVKVSR
jgi:hypothetical protein